MNRLAKKPLARIKPDYKWGWNDDYSSYFCDVWVGDDPYCLICATTPDASDKHVLFLVLNGYKTISQLKSVKYIEWWDMNVSTKKLQDELERIINE